MTMWQDVLALVLVMAACGYLARRVWLMLARPARGGCGTCSTCPTESAGGKPLVPLDALLRNPPAGDAERPESQA